MKDKADAQIASDNASDYELSTELLAAMEALGICALQYGSH